MPNIFTMPKTNMDAGTGIGGAIKALAMAPMMEKQSQMDAAKLLSAIYAQNQTGDKNFEEARGLRLTNDYRDGSKNPETELMQSPGYQNLPKFEQAARLGYKLLGKDMKSYSDSLGDTQQIYDRETIKQDPRSASVINKAYYAVKGSDPFVKIGENDSVINVLGGGGGAGSSGSYDVRGNAVGPTTKAGKMKKAQDDLNSLLDGMEMNYGTLKSSGGIVSTDNNPLENAMSSIRSNAYVGRPLGSFFGTNEESKRKEINSSRQSLLQAVMKATGMSAKSLDSNTELRVMLDSLGSPESDYESNIAIINRLRGLYGGKEMTPPSGSSVGGSAKSSGKSKPPAGVDQKLWDAMSDEDKALWN